MSFGSNALRSNNEQREDNIRWLPIPGSTQELAIDTPADQTLFCGTRGCGKTAAQLMCYRLGVGKGWGDAWTGIIFDTEYKPLVNIISQSKKFFSGLGDGAYYRAAKADQYWEWPGGEKLYFRAAKTVDDARDYLGHEYGFIGYNELSKWPTSELYDQMLGTLRTASTDITLKTKVFSTTNPYGPGAVWIRQRFIDNVPYGVLIEETYSIPDAMGRVDKVTKSKVALRGTYRENPFFRAEDIANLMEGVRGRPELESAWLHCDWKSSYVDGIVGDLWDASVHVLPNFKIPPSWKLNRCFDWGSTSPFAVGWFAETTDEEVEIDGKKVNFPNGSVIMFYEWYGSADGRVGRNRGLKLAPDQIAYGIIAREHNLVAQKIIEKGHKIYPGPADTQISGIHRVDVSTIESKMAQSGVTWLKADKSPGSRIAGAQLVRQGLENAKNRENKGFYVMQRCQATIETLPNLQRAGDDIAKDQEDHLYDVIRYRLSQDNIGAPDVVFKFR